MTSTAKIGQRPPLLTTSPHHLAGEQFKGVRTQYESRVGTDGEKWEFQGEVRADLHAVLVSANRTLRFLGNTFHASSPPVSGRVFGPK